VLGRAHTDGARSAVAIAPSSTARRGFIAAVEVLSEEPERNTADDHFIWKLRHRLLVSKAAEGNVASPEAARINPPNRVVRGPHTKDQSGRLPPRRRRHARSSSAHCSLTNTRSRT
jgi:hypothetical protein